MALPKPDDSKYRGGLTSSLYKRDLLLWEQSQSGTGYRGPTPSVTQPPPVTQTTPQPDGMLTNTNSTQMAVEGGPALEPVYTAPPADYVPDYVEPVVEPVVEYGAGSGYRGEPVVETDPFADFNRSSISGQDIDVTYSNDPSLNQDQRDASDLEYKQYTDDVLADVTFDTVENRNEDYSNFNSRLISGDTDEYDSVYSYNNMLSRGIDLETVNQWWEDGGSAQDANDLIANQFLTNKDSFTNAFDSFRTEDDMVGFRNQWEQTDFNGQVAYLENLNANGELEDEQYKQAWRDAWNSSQEGNPNPTYIIPITAPRDFDPNESIYNAPDTLEYKAGDTVYVTYTPNGINPEGNMGVVQNNTYFPNKNSEGLELQYHDNIGPKTTNLAEASTWLQFRNEFVIPGARTVLAAATGGMSEKIYTGYKIAAGETLHANDWVNIVTVGLEATGVIEPPVDIGGDMVNPIGGGTVGGQMADELLLGGTVTDGTGLLGLSYDQTVGVIDGVITGDPMKIITNVVDDGMITGALEAVGIPPEIAGDDDFIAAVTEGVTTVVETGSFTEGLEDGFVTYVEEGGSFGDLPDTGDLDLDIDLGFIEDALEPVIDAVQEAVQVVEETVEPVINAADDAIDAFGDTVVDPVLEVVKDTGSAVEDVVRDAGSAIDDAVIEPVVEVVEDTGSMIEDVVRETGSAIDDTLIEPVKEFVENIEVPEVDLDLPDIDIDIDLPSVDLPSFDGDLPSVDLPSIDLPSIDLPSFDLPSFDLDFGMNQGTRTTDSLFGRELFKFKGRDFSLVELLTQDMPKEKPEEELYDFDDDPFASTFDRNV